MADNGNKTFQQRHNEQEAEREKARAEAEKPFEDAAKENLKPSAPTAPVSKPVGAMSTEKAEKAIPPPSKKPAA